MSRSDRRILGLGCVSCIYYLYRRTHLALNTSECNALNSADTADSPARAYRLTEPLNVEISRNSRSWAAATPMRTTPRCGMRKVRHCGSAIPIKPLAHLPTACAAGAATAVDIEARKGTWGMHTVTPHPSRGGLFAGCATQG